MKNSLTSNNTGYSFKKTVFAFGFFALAILAGVYIMGKVTSFSIDMLTRDPAAVLNSNPLIGLLSNIGVIFWIFAAGVCFFSALLLHLAERKKEAVFLLSSGVVTFVLMFDDFFMFHEFIAPYYLKLPQEAVFLIYGVLMLFYLFWFRRTILQTNFYILIVSLFFMGASVITDNLLTIGGDWYLLEDGLKFAGIATWLLYFLHTSVNYISPDKWRNFSGQTASRHYFNDNTTRLPES